MCFDYAYLSLSLFNLLISIFIHVYTMVVGPTCFFFFLSSLFPSTHPRILMWFFLSFFLSKCIMIDINVIRKI